MPKGTRITLEEHRRVEELLQQGLSRKVISLRLGISRPAIHNIFHAMRRREEKSKKI